MNCSPSIAAIAHLPLLHWPEICSFINLLLLIILCIVLYVCSMLGILPYFQIYTNQWLPYTPNFLCNQLQCRRYKNLFENLTSTWRMGRFICRLIARWIFLLVKLGIHWIFAIHFQSCQVSCYKAISLIATSFQVMYILWSYVHAWTK